MDQAPSHRVAYNLVTHELNALLSELPIADFRGFVAAFPTVGAGRVFFSGQGRSGLTAQMAAMRFMHLGYDTHFVGEPTAPAIRSGDTLVIISGSGRTPVGVGFARTAKVEGADLILVTHQASSELSQHANRSMILQAAESRQFGGSLFEQAALVILDAAVLALMGNVPDAQAVMLHNHTNLQ